MFLGHRTEGAINFTLHVDNNKLPADFPFTYDTCSTFVLETDRVFSEILRWPSIERGEIFTDYTKEGREYECFELFGLTPRGSACRMWYTQHQLRKLILGQLEGIISATTHNHAETDVGDMYNAFRSVNPAYWLDIHPVRSYP